MRNKTETVLCSRQERKGLLLLALHMHVPMPMLVLAGAHSEKRHDNTVQASIQCLGCSHLSKAWVQVPSASLDSGRIPPPSPPSLSLHSRTLAAGYFFSPHPPGNFTLST